jgi:hypothetical protein
MVMITYSVLCQTPKGKHPWIEIVTDIKSVADLECAMMQEKGIFCIVVEKELNRFPENRK